jgi:hypothetical protein
MPKPLNLIQYFKQKIADAQNSFTSLVDKTQSAIRYTRDAFGYAKRMWHIGEKVPIPLGATGAAIFIASLFIPGAQIGLLIGLGMVHLAITTAVVYCAAKIAYTSINTLYKYIIKPCLKFGAHIASLEFNAVKIGLQLIGRSIAKGISTLYKTVKDKFTQHNANEDFDQANTAQAPRRQTREPGPDIEKAQTQASHHQNTRKAPVPEELPGPQRQTRHRTQ